MPKKPRTAQGKKLRNRIKDLRFVPASELKPNPKNWRTHPPAQREALRGILAEVGIADAVLARELPDGTLQLIDGHLRVEELPREKLRPQGWQRIFGVNRLSPLLIRT